MARSRARRRRIKMTSPSPPSTKEKWHWSKARQVIAVIVAAIGLASAVVTLLPRVTLEIGDPIDALDAWSAPVTVSNPNFITLDRVGLAIGLCSIRILPNVELRGAKAACDEGSATRLQPPRWRNTHHLGMDDKWRVLLQDAINQPRGFSGADITMVVTFVPWPFSWLHQDQIFQREKEFRFNAVNQPDGKYRWFPSTFN
jgi:hypothetical protein